MHTSRQGRPRLARFSLKPPRPGSVVNIDSQLFKIAGKPTRQKNGFWKAPILMLSRAA